MWRAARGTATDQLVKALDERIMAFVESSDATAVLDKVALRKAAELSWILAQPPADKPQADLRALCVLAWLHWCRRQALPPGQDRDDFLASLRYFSQILPVTPDAVPGLVRQYLAQANMTTGQVIDQGISISPEYERARRLCHLDAAPNVSRQAVAATRAGHPLRAVRSSSRGAALLARFGRTGQLVDLDAAIGLFRRAVAATPADHAMRDAALSNLGVALRARFGRTGQPVDLDGAIDAGRQAVAAAPAGHPLHARFSSNLGNALWARYEYARQPVDLNAAIDMHRQAVAATLPGHPDRAKYLSNLGIALRARSEYTEQMSDLDAAIDLFRQAVAATPARHPSRAGRLSNLGNALGARWHQTRQPDDLVAAIDLHRQAVAATPPGRPDHANYLSSLGNSLLARWDQTKQPDDLDAAVDMHRQAVAATPAHHPSRAGRLSNLGNALRARFQCTGQRNDLDAAIGCQREAAGVVTAPPSGRLQAAVRWGRWAVEAGNYRDGTDGYAAAVELLPRVAWHGLDQATWEELCSGWRGVTADATACAIAAGEPCRAVELLEAGRSLMWTQIVHQRSDLNRLPPHLAARLEQARAELERPLADTQEGLERRRRAAQEWDDTVGQVRRMEGFESFLAPTPFLQLRSAAADGSVVIVNTSSMGCHALIISAGDAPGVKVLDLPGLTTEDAVDRAKGLLGVLHRADDSTRLLLEQDKDRHEGFDILEWMWDTITRPVLDALGHTGPPGVEIERWPRVWWCPTGPLTVLPLHAAGRYPRNSVQQARQGAAAAGESVAGRVVSSYTPTLAALLRARRPHTPGPVRQLAVGMPDTPGHRPLPAVPAELDVLAPYFPEPGQARHLVGPDATRASVVDALPGHSWLHLACHGDQNPGDPLLSAFALHDGPLTVADLAAVHLDHADIAYLSACQTATGDVRLLDEALHLAAAMQLLGYRHVIATLWSIADTNAPAMADAVYARLTATGQPDPAHVGPPVPTQAARALHQAVALLREKYPGQPLLWAPYIHIGP